MNQKNMLNLEIMNREKIEYYCPNNDNVVLISISDSNDEHPRLLYFFNNRKYFFFFDDIGNEDLKIIKEKNIGIKENSLKLFDDNDAKELIKIYDYIFKNNFHFIIHCNAGISRSAGVGASFVLIKEKGIEYLENIDLEKLKPYDILNMIPEEYNETFKNTYPNTLVFSKIIENYKKQ